MIVATSSTEWFHVRQHLFLSDGRETDASEKRRTPPVFPEPTRSGTSGVVQDAMLVARIAAAGVLRELEPWFACLYFFTPSPKDVSATWIGGAFPNSLEHRDEREQNSLQRLTPCNVFST